MTQTQKLVRLAAGLAVLAITIPLFLFLGIFALGIAVFVMIAGFIASRFMPKPRWDDRFDWGAHQSDTVRSGTGEKTGKRPIIIDHE
ncbi:MAG: hypothetical protein AAGG69_07335 [Pseudomonadota bacterium]